MIPFETHQSRSIFVTGASNGIGRAIAIQFAEQGHHVCITYNSNTDKANKTLYELQKISPQLNKMSCIQLNVTDKQAVDAAIAKRVEDVGSIDCLVNNAGITKDGLFFNSDPHEWQSVVDVILNGTVNVSRACLAHLMTGIKGNIVNIASVGGLIGILGQTNYTAAKAGVIAFSKSLAKEMARSGIRVNLVAPGYIETRMLAAFPDTVRTAFLKGIPMRRFGLPIDVANAVTFLSSDQASYITGQVLIIDGGLL